MKDILSNIANHLSDKDANKVLKLILDFDKKAIKVKEELNKLLASTDTEVKISVHFLKKITKENIDGTNNETRSTN
jgi:hypothetical protein